MKSHLVVFSQSMVIQNNTMATDCESYRKIKNKEIVRIVSSVTGLKDCAEIYPGVICKNATVLKLKDALRSFNVIKMTSRSGDTYRVVSRTSFEKGRISCIRADIIVRKYWEMEKGNTYVQMNFECMQEWNLSKMFNVLIQIDNKWVWLRWLRIHSYDKIMITYFFSCSFSDLNQILVDK